MTSTQNSDDQLRERLVALARDLILIPSDATRPEEIDRGLSFLKNHLEALSHIQIKDFECEGDRGVLALPQDCQHPKVLLCGHLDVITHAVVSDYRSHIHEGKIVGPGAGDMKGQLAIMFEVFRAFHSQHPAASLGLAITTDEERGGEHGIRYLFEDLGMRCGAALIPDGGGLNDVIIEEKGMVHLKLTSEGKANHAARPWLGINPLESLIKQIRSIQKAFRPEIENEDHWHPTCTVTIIESANRSPNRIPAIARAYLDIRFPRPRTVENVLGTITECLEPHTNFETIIADEPSHLSPDPLFIQSTEKITGQAVRLIKSHGGSDARFVCRYDIPTMVSSPLVGELHSTEEWIDIESMVTFYRVYEDYLQMKLL